MGYYTEYTLIVEGDNDADYNIIDRFREEYDDAAFAIEYDGTTREKVKKWYSHEEDLADFSKAYPEVLFILEGIGEEDGDLWKLYVQGGKTFRTQARIVYDEFDISNLN